MTKVLLGALAMTGAAFAVSAPAQAQVSVGVYAGSDGGYYGQPGYGDPYGYDDGYGYDNGGYADAAPYGDAYAGGTCDYYAPPWGAPPDYCDYNLWYQPVYLGGLWYSGPFYSRYVGGDRLFWLNGGWRRDGWRGARPAHIDWGRGGNVFWNGGLHRGFAGNGGGFHGRAGLQGGGRSFAGRAGLGNRNFGGQGFASRGGARVGAGATVRAQHGFFNGARGAGVSGAHIGGGGFRGGVGHAGGGGVGHAGGGGGHGGGGHGGGGHGGGGHR
jgi:hypothetical protein